MRPLRPGDPTEIGGYRLRAHLGGGGMGSVYLASTPGGRLVAVKLIRPELMADDEFRERFRLEVRTARRVRGLYTAELLDADPDGVPAWLVTTYVPGPSLAQAVKAQGPVPYELVPLLMAGVAEALLDIHAAGIVHRDLKPSNVLLSPDGPRVIDFGIAKALDALSLTLTGVSPGSPECMTPEQVNGLPVTPAADIFSLGTLGAYAAVGRPLFDAPNPAAMMYRIVHETPALDGLPAELRLLLERCVAKDPDERPSPAGVLEMCQALMPDEPAVFPQAWRTEASPHAWGPVADNNPSDIYWTEQIGPAQDARSASGPVPLAAGGPQPRAAASWDSLANGWTTDAVKRDSALSVAPTPAREVLPEPAFIPPPTAGPRPAAAWLMYGAAALAAAALVTGLVTLPGLRATLSQQHPGSVAAAVNLAVVGLVVCALASTGTWLWAARDAVRGYRRARTVAYAALAISTLSVASNLLGLSTDAVHGLVLASWLAGLTAVPVARPRRSPR